MTHTIEQCSTVPEEDFNGNSEEDEDSEAATEEAEDEAQDQSGLNCEQPGG